MPTEFTKDIIENLQVIGTLQQFVSIILFLPYDYEHPLRGGYLTKAQSSTLHSCSHVRVYVD